MELSNEEVQGLLNSDEQPDQDKPKKKGAVTPQANNALKAKPAPTGDELIKQALIANGGGVTKKNMEDWNDFVSFLKTKGLNGSESLNHAPNRVKIFQEYQGLHPETSVKEDIVPLIQQQFIDYKKYLIGEVEKGKANIAVPGVEKPTVAQQKQILLNQLSNTDGKAGQFTTMHPFPPDYVTYAAANKLDYGKIGSTTIGQQNATSTQQNVADQKDVKYSQGANYGKLVQGLFNLPLSQKQATPDSVIIAKKDKPK